MKKFVIVLVVTLLAVPYLHAQTAETLTNSTIIKMARAKLSEELIIDEINNSKVNFSVSADSLKVLSDEHISDRVIQAMKAKTPVIPEQPRDNTVQSNPPEPKLSTPPSETPVPAVNAMLKDTLKKHQVDSLTISKKETAAPPVFVQVADTLKQIENQPLKPDSSVAEKLPAKKIIPENQDNKLTDKSVITVNALSYVIPVEELMTFFDNEFYSLSVWIQKWDQQVRDTIEKGNQIKAMIVLTEQDLTAKKNVDTKAYTDEIIALKTKLSVYREKYKLLKKNMFKDGVNLTNAFKDFGNTLNSSVSNKYRLVSQMIRSVNPDPSLGGISKEISIPKQKADDGVISFVASATEILFFYQNQISSMRDMILLWNGKADEIIQKDSELSSQSEPLKKELANYKLNPKQYKKEIAALKKQCTQIDKERKNLAKQMVCDSKELSSAINLNCKEIQASLKERFADIIENMKYLYLVN